MDRTTNSETTAISDDGFFTPILRLSSQPLFRQAAAGLSWMGALKGSTRAIVLLRTAILARLLTPEQFGIFGVVTLAVTIFEVFTETGINTILIQENKELDPIIDTAWVVSIIRGLIIFLLMVAFAIPLSYFFKSPTAAGYLWLAGLISMVKGFINPAIVSFRKNLEFKKEFRLRVAILAVESAVTLILAFVTHSVSSLVIGLIAGGITEVLLSFVFVTPKPRFRINRVQLNKIFNRGKWITLSGSCQVLVEQGDSITVGRVLGLSSLGLYNMAYKISNMPFTEITDVVAQVAFPIFSKISNDKERLFRNYKRMLAFNLIFIIPGSLIIFFFPRQIIEIVFGPQWLEAAGALKILAIFGLTRAIGGSAGPLLYSLKRQELAARIEIAKLLLLFALLFPLTIRYQITGTAMAVAGASLLLQPIIYFYVRKAINEA